MPTTLLSSPRSFCNLLLSLAEFPDSFQAAAFSIYESSERGGRKAVILHLSHDLKWCGVAPHML